ncbi:MAG: DUF3553 domain-containing protein [Alphaproteobacteria bacterium]|nr:DUF3553 domain-containing protein [Alphaproteobacteria bacterium]MDE1986210.1 DUF3553 domain-containing protein [Alphaproteobacteria bacterium]MDE2163312.1 DUF3553 domain-containing protein [Alphaproteobacteria bacterium]MDE2264645.1 DUF3553 domain-containing protein [Alphaproteobacteria bacterium]MDE2498964.1 DUF3553 domain-containing protein [Alphaproteobacteria bacterium]
MSSMLAPGQWVRLPGALDWGLGQVQSVTGNRVTVNFEHAGKRVIHIDVATLEPADVTDRQP